MAELVPVLLGTSGFVVGECYVLPDGADVVVGRSRSCDISLRRAAAYLKAAPQSRDDDHEFNTVSRRHLRLQLQASTLRINDLSTNGTFVDDQRLLREAPTTVVTGSRIRFGGVEVTFLLAREFCTLVQRLTPGDV